MRGAGVIIAADVARHGDGFRALGARNADAAAAIPEFRAAIVLKNLRARIARPAAIEDSRHAATARRVVVPFPPHRTLGARLKDVGDVAGLSEADVELTPGARDDRMGTIPDDPAVFILVEAQQDEIFLKTSGLRAPVSNGPFDFARDRVWRAVGIGGCAAEERYDIAHRGHAHAEHQRILRGISELVDQVRVEAVPQADLR